MKTNLLPVLRRILCLLLLAAGLASLSARAQQNLMSYQGFLTDGTGNPLGNTNTGPTSYSVIFRIWNQPNGGTMGSANELWAELQTVTVNKGYFSVLLGQGSQYVAGGVTEPRGNLSGVFTNSPCYIEMTVLGAGSGGANVTLLPRLQFVSSAYAFSAVNATTAYSLVNPGGTSLLSASGTNVNVAGAVITPYLNSTNLAATTFSATTAAVTNLTTSGTLNANTLNATTLNATTLGASTLNATTLTTSGTLSAGTLKVSGSSMLSGNVGIGNSSPADPLSFAQSLGDKLDLYYTSATGNYGMGISTSTLQIYCDTVGTTIAFGYGNSANFTERMRIQGNGYVGIGTTTPGSPLDVAGQCSIGGPNYGSHIIISGNQIQQVTSGSALASNPGGLYLNYNGGNVVVGNGNSYAGLTVHGSVNTGLGGGYAYGDGGYLNEGYGGTTQGLGIYSDNYVVGPSFLAFSDQRIKNIIGQSDSSADLKTLMGLKITDYTYRDKVAHSNRINKKLIAQQVEKVFPLAVSTNTDVVPDIYQTATIRDGWVRLATNLKVGERVKLICATNSAVWNVMAVRDGAFKTDFAPADGKVFVYGREVKDFRMVDYEAVAMLNVSATQEIATRQQEQTAEIGRLKDQIAGQAAQIAEIGQLKQQIADLKHLVVAMAEATKSGAQQAANDQTGPGQTLVTTSAAR